MAIKRRYRVVPAVLQVQAETGLPLGACLACGGKK